MINTDLDYDFFADIELQAKNKKKYNPKITNFDKKIILREFGSHLFSKLTVREERVLRMLTGTGLNNCYKINDIAQQLGISDFEVVIHSNNAFRKFVMNYFKYLKDVIKN